MISTDNFNKDIEATDQELKGVVYTAVSFATFLAIVTGGIVYLLW